MSKNDERVRAPINNYSRLIDRIESEKFGILQPAMFGILTLEFEIRIVAVRRVLCFLRDNNLRGVGRSAVNFDVVII